MRVFIFSCCLFFSLNAFSKIDTLDLPNKRFGISLTNQLIKDRHSINQLGYGIEVGANYYYQILDEVLMIPALKLSYLNYGTRTATREEMINGNVRSIIHFFDIENQKYTISQTLNLRFFYTKKVYLTLGTGVGFLINEKQEYTYIKSSVRGDNFNEIREEIIDGTTLVPFSSKKRRLILEIGIGAQIKKTNIELILRRGFTNSLGIGLGL